MKTVLVLAAHPDDEVLGCGGTIARRSRDGDDVHIAILGEGITSRFQNREEADRTELERLHERSREAGRIVGATQVSLFGLPDNRFDSIALLDIVKIIEGLIDRLEPSVVYTQHGGDLNIDHNLLYRATLTATRPMANCPVRELYAYEVASSTEWAFQKFEPAFRPNTFVDISDTLESKISAMEVYESEARAFPHPRSPEALRAQARRWGSASGLQAAEAFELVRAVRPS
jgi:LmbE family N-acetylglucosaminyl deacetylase